MKHAKSHHLFAIALALTAILVVLTTKHGPVMPPDPWDGTAATLVK